MALSGTYIFDDGICTINGVDLSKRCKAMKVTYGAKDLNNTAMGVYAEQKFGGLYTWTVTYTFEQDFSAGSVDATLFPLLLPGTTSTVTAKPTSAAASATNPLLSGTGLLTAYDPLTGNVGDLALCTATFQCAGALSHT